MANTPTPIPLTMHLHIYKKGNILNLMRLNEGVDRSKTNYIFSSKVGNNILNTIISVTNNVNQITGRILKSIYNLLSYFGLGKDPSEKSKHQVFLINFPPFLKGRIMLNYKK